MGARIKETPKIDQGLVQIFQEMVDYRMQGVLRAKQYLREESIKHARAVKKLNTYVKTGKILSEEELRK